MASKKCPVCGVAVKLENLERHVREQHPHSAINLGTVMNDAERDEVRRSRLAARPAMSRRGIGVASAVAIVLAVLIVLVALNPFGNVGPNVGQLAPDFSLPTTDGGSVILSSFRGTPVLLEFMDVDCYYCQQEAQNVLSVLYPNYSAVVRFLSVDANIIGAADTGARINAFRTDYNTPWPYATDSTESTLRTYGIQSTPTTFILGRDGVITRIFRGQAPGGVATYVQALDATLGA